MLRFPATWLTSVARDTAVAEKWLAVSGLQDRVPRPRPCERREAAAPIVRAVTFNL